MSQENVEIVQRGIERIEPTGTRAGSGDCRRTSSGDLARDALTREPTEAGRHARGSRALSGSLD